MSCYENEPVILIMNNGDENHICELQTKKQIWKQSLQQ